MAAKRQRHADLRQPEKRLGAEAAATPACDENELSEKREGTDEWLMTKRPERDALEECVRRRRVRVCACVRVRAHATVLARLHLHARKCSGARVRGYTDTKWCVWGWLGVRKLRRA
eukprot:4641964-Pleurochrysis_carterae.AAC.1